MSSTALARADAFTPEQIEIIKRDIAKGASDNELQFFLAVCTRTGLDPFTKQIWCIERWTGGSRQMVTQLGIDGARLIAERSGKYEGQEGPYWCGPDGIWTDCWLKREPPVAAKVLIYKRGARVPTTGIALYAESVQTKKDGTPNSFWQRQPAFQLAKCAEMNGLRRSFPHELSGLHIDGELDGGDDAYIETTGRVIDQSTGEIITPAAPKQIEVKPAPVWQAWKAPADAFAWAIEQGACANEFEAKNSLKKIVDQHGGRLNGGNMVEVFAAYHAHQLEKLAAAKPAPAVPDDVNFGMGETPFDDGDDAPVPTIHMAEQPALVTGGGRGTY